MPYRLLDEFRDLFQGNVFRHRASNQGDFVAFQFFEDLYSLPNPSAKYVARVDQGVSVLNVQNRRHGVKARRGDGSFGEIVPHVEPIMDPGYHVKRGPIATIEIGIEVKIIQKAMIRQIDRVINDLRGQVEQFKSKHGQPITIGIVGVNRASQYISYEADKEWPTTGAGRHKHPYQEADETEARLLSLAAPHFDEFLILRFTATNSSPFRLIGLTRVRPASTTARS
ncbi:MAG: hypothetical protein GEU95_13800 [Rhizobiales bacterium]|nr:hypothetical protein [Hyphomicrobiales bacterium]